MSKIITIDDFLKIEMRVAKIIFAERVEESDKLMRIELDLGKTENNEDDSEWRQVVAGIGEHYSPDDIVGKNVVVITNLEPRNIKGIESQGMILAAENKSGKVSLLTTSEDISPGSIVK